MTAYLPYLMPCAVVVFVISLIWFIGFVTGWQRMARLYPMPPVSPDEKQFRMRSLSFSAINSYNNCVTFGISDMGLSISQMIVFRIGHPPIFIPWEDLLAEKKVYFKRIEVVRLVFVSHPKLQLLVSRNLCEQLAEAAGDYWPKLEDISE